MAFQLRLLIAWTIFGLGCHGSSGGLTESGEADAQCTDAGPEVSVGCTPDSSSCAPGITNCGADKESCSTSLEVTGGTYYRTYDDEGALPGVYPPPLAPDGGPAEEADPATVSTFRLDKYLVTVGRFRQFVGAWNGGNGWLPQPGFGKHSHLNGGLGLANGRPDAGGAFEPGWAASDDALIAPTDANLDGCYGLSFWTTAPGGNENLPINCVNWYEAYAFCIWDGGFLASEAEWEYAAAGGSEQRLFPWGSSSPGRSSQYAIFDCIYPDPYCQNNCNIIAPVGSAPLGAGRWGQLDLEGEVAQWTLDWYDLAYSDPCIDCANLVDINNGRVAEGNGNTIESVEPERLLYVPIRGLFADQQAISRSSGLGFRCARSP